VYIRKIDPESFVNAYNVDLQLLYPWEGVVEPPFGAVWAVLAPGETTKPHAHQECETFIILEGQGLMSVGEEQKEVGPGDTTFHRPFDNHVLTNTSDREPLTFVSIFWEERERWADGGGAQAAARPVERVLVTAAPPTPNGDLHVGHLAGPYSNADFHARFLRLQGLEAHFVCGTDDNSIYVKTQGRSMGLTPEAAADHFADGIVETLEAAGIDLAVFPRPNASPHHHRLTQEFLRGLYDGGHLEARETEAPYCGSCDQVLFEAYIGGRCPGCGTGVVGNVCEDCGRVYDPAEIVEPRCTQCGAAPGTKPIRQLFFPLSRHVETLREHYRRVSLAPHVRALVEGALARGLPDVAVTLPTDWGIEVPVEGYEEQRIFVWLEMAPRYFAYVEHLNDKLGVEGGWERYWKFEAARIVQFFGYDNSFYYAALIPAMLKAFDPEIRLPEALVTNEFYYLEGQKFSTSRDHRILGRDILQQEPRDAVRFYVAYTAPEREETNFVLEDFHGTIQTEIHGRWLGWLKDLGERLVAGHEGKVPATGDWTEDHRRFFERLEGLLREAEAGYSVPGFSPQRATRALTEIVREARRFAAGESHWRGVPTRTEEVRTALALECLAAKLLGLAAAPVMPDFATALWRALGYTEGPGGGSWKDALEWVPAGADASALATVELLG
jgi:methionyl-tRNA synthetase